MTPLQMLLMKGGNALNKADEFMQKPGGNFLMNLLAQSGYSTTPDSPLGAVGRAGIMTQQQQRQSKLDDMNKRLIEAQIYKYRKDGDEPVTGNVQSTFEGQNGNVWVVTRGGETKDTGVPYNSNIQLITQPDKSVVAVDLRTGLVVGRPVTPQDATESTISGAVNEDTAKRVVSAPKDIAKAESQIYEISTMVDDVNQLLRDTGISTVGPSGAILSEVPGFKAYDYKVTKDRVTSYLSLDKIAEMKAQSASGATGLGAVNEREFDALSKARANLDQATSPGQMKRELSRLLFTLNRINQIAMADIEKARMAGGEVSEGFSLVEDK